MRMGYWYMELHKRKNKNTKNHQYSQ